VKVFLSWSGDRSRQVADALRDWLPGVLQVVEPWLSSKDLVAGDRWSVALTKALEETRTGVICLTKDNIDASWLHFEAGALSKVSGESLLCLYALDLEPSDLRGPFSQFQMARADQEGTFALLEALNRAADGLRLSESNLRRVFDLWWPELAKSLAAIPAAPQSLASGLASPLEERLDKVIGLLEGLVQAPEARSTPSAGGVAGPGKPNPSRPRGFIGSSTEGLAVAHAIQELLDPMAECTVWNQGVFTPGSTFIDSLQDARLVYDFAVIVLTSDDTTTSRGKTGPAPRDNLLFEMGLFAGALGRARTFLVLPADTPPRLPSDLSGVTTTMYRARRDGNLVAALAPAVSQIARAMGIETRAE
jgi:predicted nucleotide-binding protein